jgi:formate hydrogenlyase subunit 6/NADH:ubiquinone oxidoreductase subunit I
MSDILQMFTTIIKSLFKKSACKMYPVLPATFYERTKGHIVIEAEKCILCSLCARKCPTNAIQVNRALRTWQIDHGKCIVCNNCVDNCPPKCLAMANQYAEPTTQHTIYKVSVPEKKPLPTKK